ncbi:MAG: four helix bundle protein [Akkermansiaceae bacterium]|nr:four helix bundle protein [Akkermansiaceae bacterium]MCP5549355.1 four helix bundle protein [Akkermansiaceae bacterium]
MKSGKDPNESGGKPYDLEERTERFAKDVRVFPKTIPMTIANLEDIKQLVRASGSQSANYIEANEAVSKKDFAFRVKVCRKEAKESGLFLRLLDTGDSEEVEDERRRLNDEAGQLTRIFGSIIRKSDGG